MTLARHLPRNDPRQYDDLVEEWWNPGGAFAMLHWLAETRAQLVPKGSGVLVDIACGGGLMAPYVKAKGYTHIGVDITSSALERALIHGVQSVRGSALALPIADESASVVCAGEILEHVTDMAAVVAESCRVLRPGGTVVLDTIANTAIGRFLAVTVAERIPGGAPKGIHDPKLFVDRKQLVAEYAKYGVQLKLQGLRPSLTDVAAWKLGRRQKVRMLNVRSTSVLFQGWGVKQ